ncbi:MAG: 2-oxoacid:ferredoxin oxidoreductase subunit beta, partial [Halobacteriota archaeon]|nr:2-oxoacid:ferredoxin oxidoreductase subunit beta [Halobacteriota archaeon]
AGATFIARGYPAKLDQLTEIMVSAVEHEGFSIVEVLQPCVSFNNTYALYNEATEVLKKTPKSYDEAMRVIKAEDKIPIGVLYQVTRPTYHRELYGDLNPAQERLSKENRRERISQLLRV